MTPEFDRCRILHVSDLQVGRPFLPEAGEALVSLARELSPDLLVVSGDLTQRAKEREYACAKSLLDAMRAPMGTPMLCVAGNHDVPLYRFWERLVCPWRKWERHIGARRSVLRLPGCAMAVALSTAAPRRAIVNGRLKRRDLDFAELAFSGVSREEFRLLVIHHGLSGTGVNKELPDAEFVLERIAAMGVDVVLSGHEHASSVREVNRGGRSFHVLQAGTATSSRWRSPEDRVNSVNLLEIGAPPRASTSTDPHTDAAGSDRYPAPVQNPSGVASRPGRSPVPGREPNTGRRDRSLPGNKSSRSTVLGQEPHAGHRSPSLRPVREIGTAAPAAGRRPITLARYCRADGESSFVRAGSRRLVALLLATAAFSAGQGSLAATQLPAPRVGNVEFVGNATFPADSLARIVATRASECVSVLLSPFCWAGAEFASRTVPLRERDLEIDAARLRTWYHQRGYREVSLEVSTAELEDGSIDVLFTIDEGRPVLLDSFEVTGIPAPLLDSVLSEDLPASGEPLDVVGLEVFRDSLEERLANRGYAYARALRQIFIPTASPYSAEVAFEVSPGPLVRYGPITVTGNTSLGSNTILATAQIAQGGEYSREALRDARARLFGLDIVRRVDVVPDSVAILLSDSVLPLEIEIIEGDAYRIRYGAGLNGAECLDAEARWTARNFAGAGRMLGVRGRVSNILAPQLREIVCPQGGVGEFAALNWFASLDFSQPWVFSSGNALAATLFAERSSVPNVFVREAVGATAALTRPLDAQTGLVAGYGVELSTLSAAGVLFCANLLVCDPADIAILTEQRRLAPIGLRLNRTLVSGILNPTSGHVLRLDYEYAAAWTGSEFTYHRLVGEGTWYSRASSRVVLAARVRGGWIGGTAASTGSTRLKVHPTKRFYAGGASSVRGFSQGGLGPRVLYAFEPAELLGAGRCDAASLADLSCDPARVEAFAFTERPTGGNKVIEANLETRVGISTFVEGVLFADLGQVWDDEILLSLSELEVTPGLGVRYASPIGPLRFDIGYQFRAEEDLPVVTPLIAPHAGRDHPDQLIVDGEPIPWIATSNLALLDRERPWGGAPTFSVDRLRFHVSIGQAF